MHPFLCPLYAPPYSYVPSIFLCGPLCPLLYLFTSLSVPSTSLSALPCPYLCPSTPLFTSLQPPLSLSAPSLHSSSPYLCPLHTPPHGELRIIYNLIPRCSVRVGRSLVQGSRFPEIHLFYVPIIF